MFVEQAIQKTEQYRTSDNSRIVLRQRNNGQNGQDLVGMKYQDILHTI